MKIMTPSKEQKIEMLEKLGLNLKECKIDEQTMISLTDLLYEYRDDFDVDNPPKDSIPNFSYKIPLKDGTPVWKKNFKVQADVNLELEKHILKLLEQGVIERTSSPYKSPILCVAKPDSKETRFLLDCRAINERIVTNYNYIHDAEHVIQRILQCRAKYFSKFDLKSAFFSLNLDPESRHVTAFSHPNLGQFFFCRLVQGIKSSPSVFCQVMNQSFSGMSDFLHIYMDDMLLCDQNESRHLEHIQQTLQKVRENNLRINRKKTKLFVNEVNFIGYVINQNDWTTSPDKIKSILSLPPPRDVRELKQLLGSTNYYRRFFGPAYNKNIAVFTRLFRKDVPYNFDSECMTAFKEINQTFQKSASFEAVRNS